MMPYQTALTWDGRRGWASLNGIGAPITSPPAMGGEPVHMVEYVPALGVKRIQPRAIEAPRDLLPDEEELILRYLQKMMGAS